MKLDRINVVGSSGAGKSTVAKALATKLNLPLVQLDQLFWRPNWTNANESEMISLLKENLERPKWVLDGNFGKYEPIKWKDVQTVVWVDTPFLTTLWQVTSRCVRRAWTQGEIWEGTGCRESFRKSFFSTDSIILWMLRTFWNYRKTYSNYILANSYPHIKWVRLKNRREVREFIESI